MKKFYRQFIKEGSLCFDVCANVGNFSEIFLELNANVIALEPLNENFLSLNKRFESRAEFKALQLAVSSESGIGEIHKGNFLELSSLDKEFVEFNERQFQTLWKERQKVSMVTLNELIADFGVPVFCKIDVEGHEREVLLGLNHLIPVISFEFIYPFKEKAIECVQIIDRSFPNLIYNYSLFEFFKFENTVWLNSRDFIEHFRRMPPSHHTGDIFCKTPN